MKITLAHHIFLSIVRAGFLFLVFIMRPIYFLLYEKETQLTKPSSPLLMKSATELADLIRKQVVSLYLTDFLINIYCTYTHLD